MKGGVENDETQNAGNHVRTRSPHAHVYSHIHACMQTVTRIYTKQKKTQSKKNCKNREKRKTNVNIYRFYLINHISFIYGRELLC